MKNTRFAFVILYLIMNSFVYAGLWKGNAVIGNGNFCLVYSDDPRIIKENGGRGIQHFYFRNYTADYIRSSSFTLSDESPAASASARSSFDLSIENSFCAYTKTMLPGGRIKNVRCYALPEDAAVASLDITGNDKPASYNFTLSLRKKIITDRKTVLTRLKKELNAAFAEWSDKTVIVAAPKSPSDILEVNDSTVTVYGKTSPKNPTEIIILAASSHEGAVKLLKALRASQDLYKKAQSHWNNWLAKGSTPDFKNRQGNFSRYADFYGRTLYAVKAATLNGMVPADITGQFLTNNMPQLYPRDAMMCARVFLQTGHLDEAADILKFWARGGVPMKSKGEFYARYDAYAKAVDAGSGARYDEPEWDANGYYIQLVNEYYKKTGTWLAEKTYLYELADFLVKNIDKNGLLYEGGIVEWTGWLPSTNMTCSSALSAMSEIAKASGDIDKSNVYKDASELISRSLAKTFDTKRSALCAVRFHGVKAEGNYSISEPAKDTLYLWDTSLNFGVLYGFPDNEMIRSSNEFIETNNVKNGGGVQYFEAKDNAWLSAYGGDLFFFTTAAAAQYHTMYGDNNTAKKHIDWMINNSNSYGLMPERIFQNQSDCSPASPLSWCNAEFALSLLKWSENL